MKYSVDEFISKSVSQEFVALELGCGNRKRDTNAIGIDLNSYEGVDIVGDAIDILRKFSDESVDEICSYHFLEHVIDMDSLLGEMTRILKLNGKIISVVPHFSNPFFYSDPTHNRYFGLYTFGYYAQNRYFKRKLPEYCLQSRLYIQDIQLIFKSYPPRFIRHAFKKVIEKIVNSNVFLQEFYEENMAWIIPCYEVKCEITKE